MYGCCQSQLPLILRNFGTHRGRFLYLDLWLIAGGSALFTIAAMDAQRRQALGLAAIALLLVLLILLRRLWGGA
jgi:hypothetical protein